MTADFSDFNVVINRMLSNVPDGVDKREGGVIYDALAPCARELVDMYTEIQDALKNTFAGTADREWLIKRCAEAAITPNAATKAIRKGRFTPASLKLSNGTRFSLGSIVFRITEATEIAGEYLLECETAGRAGNDGEGYIVPINYIDGLKTAELLPEVIVFGEEEEDTEALRERYFETLPTRTLDGNIAQYAKWCREYDGIGNYKIFPEWNGKNTVKVSILATDNSLASKYLIDEFQKWLDPKAKDEDEHGEGLGMGQAPIGAICTVTTAKEVPIDVHAVLSLRTGFDEPVDVEKELAEYFKKLNYTTTIVSYVAISAVLQNNYSIDVTLDTTVNGAKENIILTEEEIAKLGSFTYEVVNDDTRSKR